MKFSPRQDGRAVGVAHRVALVTLGLLVSLAALTVAADVLAATDLVPATADGASDSTPQSDGTSEIATPARADADPPAEPVSSPTDPDEESLQILQEMLVQGQVVQIREDDQGKLALVKAFALIHAPRQVVWDVLTDYESYPEYMPQTESVTIVGRGRDTVDVDVNLGFKFSVLNMPVSYRLRQHQAEPHTLRSELLSGDFDSGSWIWRLWSVEDGRSTVVAHTAQSDLESLGWTMRYLLRSSPSMETAINVSSAWVVVQAVQSRAEKLAEAGATATKSAAP